MESVHDEPRILHFVLSHVDHNDRFTSRRREAKFSSWHSTLHDCGYESFPSVERNIPNMGRGEAKRIMNTSENGIRRRLGGTLNSCLSASRKFCPLGAIEVEKAVIGEKRVIKWIGKGGGGWGGFQRLEKLYERRGLIKREVDNLFYREGVIKG